MKFIITLGICKGHGLKLIPCSRKSLLTRVLALPSKLALALKELSLQTMVIILGFIRACVIIGTLSQTKEETQEFLIIFKILEINHDLTLKTAYLAALS